MAHSEKIVLVTGATAGIGRATALLLARQGHVVVLGGRDEAKTKRVLQEIQAGSGNQNLDMLIGDLGSQRQILDMTMAFGERYGRLDALINNAGTFSVSRRVTEDGIELTFAVNYLARFLLSQLMVPYLQKAPSPRIVNLNGIYYKKGVLKFGDLQLEQDYSWSKANSQSKLADVLGTYSLAEKLRDAGISVNCLHPGAVRTGSAFRDPELSAGLKLMIRVMGIFFKSPASAAELPAWLAVSEEAGQYSGKYFIGKKVRTSTANTYDQALQEQLWTRSMELLIPEARERLLTLEG